MTYSLQRTNPRIASNIKLVVDDKDNMYLESINSNFLLERSVYKAYEYNEIFTWGTNVKNFANQFADKNLLYDVVDETAFNVTDRTELQYHQTYDYGAYSDASKLIEANYRFFAPLHVSPGTTMPEAFVIIKVPAVDSDTISFSALSKYVDEGNVVKVFDLSKQQKVFNSIEQSSIDMQFESGTITNGLSLNSGLMTTKSESIIEAMLANESTITEFENGITNNYREHELIYSNVINMEFAFNDDNTSNEFTRYIGFYVNYNEVGIKEIRDYLNTGTIKLYRHENGYSKYDPTHNLQSYDVIKHSQFANGFGLLKAPQARLKVVLKPVPGSQLIVKYNDIVEFTLTFTSSNVGMNINTAAEFIADQLNSHYTGQYSSFTSFVENGNEVLVRANSVNLNAENVTFETPATINFVQPKFNGTGNVVSNLIGSTNKTISLNTYYNPEAFNKLQYIDDDGVKRSSEILMVTEYAGDYLYHLADQIENKAVNPDTVWFVETLMEQLIICSVLEHRDFDFDTTESQYKDILDFDIVAYKQYLVDIINSEDFRGRADALYDINHPMLPATEAEIAEYKDTLLSYVDTYFDSIDLNRNYLFKDIDINTEEASTTSNEYERLGENTIEQLLTVNRLYKFIHKWSYIAGTDVYSNDYRLNIALPFRFDSFTPSLEAANRDIRYHTHSWLIIGEGRCPYLPIVDENVHKLLSYSRLPLTRELLLSKTIDAYEYLQYETHVRRYDAWSTLVWNVEQEACYTYFRGVLLRFDDKTLNDYRFAAVLFSATPVEDDVLKMEFIRNDEHKTLTLVVNFYIPDPILTTVEQDPRFYYLDRSLLYFSNEIYSTGQDAINFGTDDISLSLYNNVSPKTYLGQTVTNDWFYTPVGGDTLLYVSRGDLTRFNTALDSIMQIGEDFTIFFTVTEDDTLPGYGMEITFEDIQEVTVNHFWCKRIMVKHILTHDPDGVDDLDINDNIVDNVVIYDVHAEYLLDNDLFTQNNICYISRAIAYENATYNKVVNASSNNARYRELSLANIAALLSSTDILRTNDDNETTQLRCSVIDPTKTNAVISLFNETDELLQLANTYLFPIIRHDGKYQPQTKTLLSFDSDDRYERIFAKNLELNNRYKLSTSRLSESIDRVKSYSESHICDIKFEEFFEYSVASIEDDVASTKYLPWISNPIEWRSFVSTVFNSAERLSYVITKSDESDLAVLLYDHVKNFCPFASFDITAELKQRMLELKYDVSSGTTANYDIEREIVGNFIRNTFIKIYDVESILTPEQTHVNFTVDSSILTILDDIEPGTELQINFKR